MFLGWSYEAFSLVQAKKLDDQRKEIERLENELSAMLETAETSASNAQGLRSTVQQLHKDLTCHEQAHRVSC